MAHSLGVLDLLNAFGDEAKEAFTSGANGALVRGEEGGEGGEGG